MTNIAATTKRNRIYWMDNLRTIIILMVVLYHIGGIYEAAGMWGSFWIVDDPDTITWVGIVGIFFDIIVMPTIFLVSGYLTPPSLDSKTSWQFLKGKFWRLMVPWAFAVLTLIPLYKVIFLFSRGLPQEHWTTYFHFTNDQSWLWFLPVLFLFNVVYMLASRAGISIKNISLKWAVLGSFVIAMISSFFIGSLVGFRSWTITPLLDFENERVLVYFMMFLLGALCYRQHVFAEKPQKKTLYTIANATSWIPVTVHIFTRIWPFFTSDPAAFVVTPVYRLVWWLSFHGSVLTVVYLLVESFRRYVNRGGWLWRELNRNSYGVYIIHVILAGIFATLLLGVTLPAVVKWLLVIVSTYVGSNLLVSLYLRAKKELTEPAQSKLAAST